MIPWKRFWCRFGEPIHVGEHAQGFLTDPDEEFTKAYNPNLFTLDQLLTESCLILCGDPGFEYGVHHTARAWLLPRLFSRIETKA